MELKRNRRGNGNGKRMRILHEVLDWSRVIATGLALAFVISNTLIANAQVPKGSM